MADGELGDSGARVERLEAELATTQARLREVDHRMKNDLQLIASVFILQMRKLSEGPEREAVRGALDRISAVSAVHRRLDVTADPKRFEASALVREVVEEAAGAAQRDDVEVTLHLSPVIIPTRQAAPLALLVGELTRNSLKHAFPARSGHIDVALGSRDGTVTLSIRDDGVGLPAGEGAPHGFGATLAGLLSQQLRGHYEVTPGAIGVTATVRFPESA